ncbi:hypothetical protein SRABI76_02334 [Microbacterium oxydans]|uniref:PqqD family protein n=1 Tax=Microbacterium oxydans TaxID=82380 RepID=UPI001DCA1012|nr:PqqD family protein [Microbacterium oxydans]CAH0213832.1 hypothetical protein SRABI76_02334 [Microbacterium oxydans]
MADRFVVEAMGIPVEVDVSGLGEEGASRARNLLNSRIITRDASHTISAYSPTGRDSSAISDIARKVSEVVRSERPHLWWVAIKASLIGADGVVLVCRTHDPIGSDGTSSQNQVGGEAVVGIDSEGGLDPMLCLSSDLSWRALSALGGSAEKVPSFARLQKIVIAERVSAGAVRMTESLPLGEALQALIAASRGLVPLRDAKDALEGILKRTGGAVRVRYTDSAELETSVRSLATQLQSDPPVWGACTAGEMEPEEVLSDSEIDGATNRVQLWTTGTGAVWTSVADHTYVLNTSDPSAVPILLEQSAHNIWQELAAQRDTTISQIVRHLSVMYGVSGEEIADSVDSLLRELRDRGLVTSTGFGSP